MHASSYAPCRRDNKTTKSGRKTCGDAMSRSLSRAQEGQGIIRLVAIVPGEAPGPEPGLMRAGFRAPVTTPLFWRRRAEDSRTGAGLAGRASACAQSALQDTAGRTG